MKQKYFKPLFIGGIAVLSIAFFLTKGTFSEDEKEITTGEAADK